MTRITAGVALLLTASGRSFVGKYPDSIASPAIRFATSTGCATHSW